MLACKNLTLNNSLFSVFQNLSFDAKTASTTIIKGSNGCGKTSLLKIIAGLIKPTHGEITWNNVEISKDILAFQENICYIGHKNALKKDMTVLENLKFWAEFSGEKELLDASIKYFDLANILETKVELLSSGWQRKVELSKLLSSNSSLWLLDEPETSLDKNGLALLKNLIDLKTQNGGVVIIATHSDLGGTINAQYINLEKFHNEISNYTN
ncbi:MAG: heme ABC exporter ATP-binding protein CcmA [Alphaproteobacteria bacterium]|nr:heme ABC exporter ATP-binding protein CcmA [Alphaproteobacteria bacterium]